MLLCWRYFGGAQIREEGKGGGGQMRCWGCGEGGCLIREQCEGGEETKGRKTTRRTGVGTVRKTDRQRADTTYQEEGRKERQKRRVPVKVVPSRITAASIPFPPSLPPSLQTG